MRYFSALKGVLVRTARFFDCLFGESRFWIHLVGRTRRFYLVHFRKAYVRRQLSVREGACHQCGQCCDLLFTCPMLTSRGRCLIYNTWRPQVCKVFPIDQRDIDEIRLCGGECGYRFVEAPAGQQGA